MNFGRIIRADCLNAPPPPDARCSDHAFALANPDVCPVAPQLIIKPSVAITCELGSVQFRAFMSRNGQEEDVTGDAVFSSGDLNTAMVGALSGNATGMAAGEVLINATYDGKTASARLSVLAGDTCCQNQSVAMMLVVDRTKSMSLRFDSLYATRLDFAKAAAKQFITDINGDKDQVGLMSFDRDAASVVAEISSAVDATEAAVNSIVQTQALTSFTGALETAISRLNAVSADRKILVLISDGEDKTVSYSTGNNPIQTAADFKDQGGIVLCLGVRAAGAGYALLSALATGGFFINAYPEIGSTALRYLSGVKGYLCAGDCTPDGDTITGEGALNYASFANWDVTGGAVDLLGNGFFDYLPGNGLYVDLMSGTQAGVTPNGKLVSKVTYPVVADHKYRLTVELAGNQVLDDTPYSARVRCYWVDDGGNAHYYIDQEISINDYAQDFHHYAFTFSAEADHDVYLSIQQEDTPAGANVRVGLLLNSVRFENLDDLVVLLYDDFDGENQVYVPPRCGVGTTYVWLPDLNSYGYATGYNCYGNTCLDEPPPVQQPDPNPLTDIEAGTTPPTRTYTSTRTACAECPGGTVPVDSASLIPVMTSATEPSGEVICSSQAPANPAWQVMGPMEFSWFSNLGGLPEWIGYSFEEATTVAAYGIGAKYDDHTAYAPKAFQFQGSNDAVNWTTLDTKTNFAGTYSVEQQILLSEPATYQHYRLLVTEVWQQFSTNLVQLTGFALYGESDTSATSMVPEMTSATEPAGEVIASSAATTNPAWYPFGDLVTPWVSSGGVPQWIGYDFGRIVTIKGYALTDLYNNYGPRDFQFQSSADGQSWTTLDTQTDHVGSFEINDPTAHFTLSAPANYRYFRLYVTRVYESPNPIPGATPDVVQIFKLAFYGSELSSGGGGGTTDPVKVCRTASFISYVSQKDADDRAYAAALSQANAALDCAQLYTSTQQYTAHCPAGSFGQTATRSATATSSVSQQDADLKALASATELAEAALDCSVSNNTQAIVINDRTGSGPAPATPYPSVKHVSGLTGTVTKVTVSLPKLTHEYPADMLILLRGPDGKTCALMANAGGSNAMSAVDLVFDDDGSALPQNSAIASGTYQPTVYPSMADLPSPAPQSPYGTTLAEFNGIDPNGSWSLWIADDTVLSEGSLPEGWDLTITTA